MVDTLKSRELHPAASTSALVASHEWQIERPVALEPKTSGFCHDLARANMMPYLAARGQTWDAAAWADRAATRPFWLLARHGQRAGFATTQADRYGERSRHIGDLQLIPSMCGLGGGSAMLNAIIADAIACGCSFISLNVFVDNPAVRLYKRFGFEETCVEDDKFRMYKPLVSRQTSAPQ